MTRCAGGARPGRSRGARYPPVMGFATTAFVVVGAAALGLGARMGLAFGLYVHHRRRSRLVGFALHPSLSFEEGPALLGGTVDSAADESSGPVLAVDVPALPARGQRMRARPFTLVLPSGAKIGVELEEGRDRKSTRL